MSPRLTFVQLQQVLRGACERAGGIRAFARLHGIGYQHVWRVATGERQSPGPQLLDKLGYVESVSYFKKK